MRRLRISPLAAGGLLLLMGLNGACVFWITRTLGADDPIEIPAVAWEPDTNASLMEATGLATPPNSYPETLARPIFFRDRRPHVPPPPQPAPTQAQPVAAAVPPPPITKPDLVVSGIALIGDAKQAYLGAPSNPDGVWVREGDDIIGWYVSSITSTGVTISRAGQSFDLLLYEPVRLE